MADGSNPDFSHAFRESGLAPSFLPTMDELWNNKDEKMDIENKQEPDVSKNKTEMSTFVLHTHPIFLTLSTGGINRLKIF